MKLWIDDLRPAPEGYAVLDFDFFEKCGQNL